MSHYIGYGVSPWGTGPWGDGYPETGPDAQGGKAYAIGDRVVRVQLEIEPLHFAITGFGDALNPRSWQIQDPATGRLWNLLSVRQVDNKTYEILTLETLPRYFTELELASFDLVTVDGIPYPTLRFPFNGCYLSVNNTADSRLAASGVVQKDYKLVIGAGYGDLESGTLEINSSGDYVSESGVSFVKKLILRRLIAKKGDFFHLPNYGIGLRVKEPLPVNDLRKLAAAIEQEVNKEPEVQASKANLSYSASAAALNVQILVRLKPNGQTAQVALTVPTGLVQL